MPSSHRSPAVRIDKVMCHRDPRGGVFEPLTGEEIARFRNVHVVISVPGAVRGNHRHARGTEVTTVTGPTWVRYREGDAVHDAHVPPGEVWRFEFPAGVAHAFKNTGEQASVIASFNTEPHDPTAPDVVREVLIEV